MYLIERLSGITLYLVVLLCVVYYIYHTKKIGKVLVVYALILAVMAFFYKPTETADLFRIYEAMDYFSKMPWSIFYKEILSSATPAYLVYLRLVGKVGIQELLPAITAYFYYMNVFYVVKRSALKYSISNKSVSLIIIVIMSFGQFIQVISGIRSMLAFSIIVRCMYEEILENKNFLFNIWKYIIAFLLHPVGIVACVIRFFYEVFCFKARTYVQVLFKVIVILGSLFVSFKFGIPYIENMLNVAQGYIGNNIYSYFWEYLMASLYLIMIAYSLYKYRYYLRQDAKIYSLVKLLKILIVMLCVLFFEYSIFQRFAVFVSMLFIPVYAFILKKVEYNIIENEIYIKIMVYYPLSILLIACLRGNLSAYKFFVL